MPALRHRVRCGGGCAMPGVRRSRDGAMSGVKALFVELYWCAYAHAVLARTHVRALWRLRHER